MICNTRIFGTYHDKEYSLIYNNGYQVINYTNFTNYNQCFNISTLEKNKQSKYINGIKDIIHNSQYEELITNLNDLIKNKININYIDENKELIIEKDEMTISFTSTYIQRMNENNINATTINLGKL